MRTSKEKEAEQELQARIEKLERRLHDTERLLAQYKEEEQLTTSFNETFSPMKTLAVTGRFIADKKRWNSVWIHLKNLFFWTLQKLIILLQLLKKYSIYLWHKICQLSLFLWKKAKTFYCNCCEKYGSKKCNAISIAIVVILLFLIFQPWLQISISIAGKDSDAKTDSYAQESRATEYNGKKIVYPDKKQYYEKNDTYKRESSNKNVITPDRTVEPRKETPAIKPATPAHKPVTPTQNVPASTSETPEEVRLELLQTAQNPNNLALERIEAIEELAKENTPTMARHFMKLLDDDSSDVRWQVARRLGTFTIREKTVAEKLSNIVADKSQALEFRRECTIALGAMGSVVDEKILFGILANKNEDEELRNNAIIALNSIGDGDIAKNLVPYLNDESPMIKETVITTLGSFAYPFATKQLLDILATEKEYGIQKETIHALGQITDKARIILPKIIERWYIEKDETLRQELRDAIENLYLKEDVESTYKNEAIKILAK